MKNRFIDIAIIVLVYVFCSSFPLNYFIHDSNVLLLVQAGLKILAFIFAIIFVKYSKNIANIKRKANFLLIMLLFPTIAIVFNNLIYVSIINASPSDTFNGFEFLSNLVFIIATGLVEEYIFRKIILDNLTFKNSLVRILVSAGIFGGLHIVTFLSTFNPFDLLQIVYTAGLGIVFGFFYEYGKNLVMPIIIHILFNFLNNYMYGLYIVPEVGLTYFLVAIIASAIVGVYLLVIYFGVIKKLEELNIQS